MRRSAMKTKDLIAFIRRNGWYLKRNGGSHDIYTNGKKAKPSLATARSKKPSQKRLSNETI